MAFLSIPNKITPGTTREITNQPMNQYNDLRNAMLVFPEVLDAVVRHFAEDAGMISSLLAHFDNYYSPYQAKKKGEGYYKMMQKKFKFLGNHEFAWRGEAPRGYVYRFTRDAEGTLVNGLLGVNGQPFYVYIDRDPVDSDDIFRLGDMDTQIMVTHKPIATGRLVEGRVEYKCRVRFMLEHPDQGLNPVLVNKGMEAERHSNIKPEASSHGSKVRVSFGDWYKNYMTTMRWEWNVTGHVAHTKTDTKWVVYTGEDGSIRPYWIPVLDYEMMRTAQRFCENFLWDGRKAINPNGTFLKDTKGRDYISGDGAYTQCNKKLRTAYNKLTIELIEQQMKTFKLDSIGIVGDPMYAVVAGLNYRVEFDKLFRNVFSASPEPLFFHEGDGFKVKSDFMCYESPLGKFFVYNGDYLDSKFHPSVKDQYGDRYSSSRAFIVNFSKFTGGDSGITLVSRAGRNHVIGDVVGMANVGDKPGNILTTTDDVQGRHMMKEIGIATLNPHMIGEMYKPIPL